MIWGSIWLGGRSKIVVMERDPLSRKNGYTSASYIWSLEEGYVPHIDEDRIFMQDNAAIHTAKVVKEWHLRHGVELMKWPPHSPDMNPIEHVWIILKRNLARMHPEVFFWGNNQFNKALFTKYIEEAWEAIPQAEIDNLIRSMPHRIEALRKAKGSYTKY